ncbi:MAG: transposase family protein [Tannerellaceae bacterium]|nr:transposase family protein [Tannerellaceae bacterium]
MESPLSYFRQLPDPRIDRCKEHSPEDIIFITIAAVGSKYRREKHCVAPAIRATRRRFMACLNFPTF